MCPEVFSCSPSSSLTEVFEAYLVCQACPALPARLGPATEPAYAQGLRDVLLLTSVFLTQDTGLFALDYRDTWKNQATWGSQGQQTHSLTAPRL